MDAERWQQVDSIFQLALDVAPQTRSAFLDSACGDDAGLRDEVESLLFSYEESGGARAPAIFQEGLKVLEHRARQRMAGSRIGDYRLIREVAHGGMGAVYLGARADEAFQKFVAIKILRCGLDTEDFIQRFRTERQILATLDHPNIAHLLDGGTTEDGLPYFVMEYIDGEPIDQYCDARKLNTRERLKLFQRVCGAVRYAHENLVVHRDIKPSNVLVTKDGVPRLLDFGIAKIIAPGDSSLNATITAMRPLTPEFASPEQIHGRPIGTASDVYSLGVLLYVLLTGHLPYRAPISAEIDIEAAICRELPEKPSLRVLRRESLPPAGTVPTGPEPELASETREGTPERLRRRLQGDLDAIVLMAIRKEPERRYSSVEQFSTDIDRHLRNLPVMARLDTHRYRTTKFIQRHKAGVAATVSVFLILVAGIMVTVREAYIARQERDRARVEQAKAARINAFLQEMVGYSGVTPGTSNHKAKDATVADMLDDAAQRVETELADQPEVKAEMLGTIGSTYIAQAKLDLAVRYLREAYDLDLKLYGPNARQTAAVMNPLADLAYLKGDNAAADSLFGKALPIYRAHANDPELELRSLVAMLSDAAFVKRALGQFSQAEGLWREALAYGPRLPAKYRAQAIVPKTFLAQLSIDRGDVETADALASEASRELRAWGGDRFSLAQSLIDLGNVRRLEGRYDEAAALIREGPGLYAQAQGPSHPNVAYGFTTLAITHFYQGLYVLAEQDARTALKIVEKLPQGSHYVSGAYIPLGMVLSKTGRTQEAEHLLREALAIREERSPRLSTPVAIAMGCLGECLAGQKRYAEAEPFLTESFETLRSIHVPQSPILREAARRLFDLYSEWEKPQEAAPYQAIAFATAKK